MTAALLGLAELAARAEVPVDRTCALKLLREFGESPGRYRRRTVEDTLATAGLPSTGRAVTVPADERR